MKNPSGSLITSTQFLNCCCCAVCAGSNGDRRSTNNSATEKAILHPVRRSRSNRNRSHHRFYGNYIAAETHKASVRRQIGKFIAEGTQYGVNPKAPIHDVNAYRKRVHGWLFIAAPFALARICDTTPSRVGVDGG